MAPTRQHHNKIIMFYNSKNAPKKSSFVEYHFSAIYIKKASIQSVLFCEAWRYQLVQDAEVLLQSKVSKVVDLLIFQTFHFHPNHFVCYFAIKWSIFDLKGRFFDENMIDFNREHVRMLYCAIRNCFGCYIVDFSCFYFLL